MICPQNRSILGLISGQLAQLEQERLREHLAACSACAAAYAELMQTWDQLGAWTIDRADLDLTARVLEATSVGGAKRGPAPLAVVFGAGRLRAAASILLAAGLGIAAGELVPLDRPTSAPQLTPAPTAEELAQELGLSDWSTQSATGLPLGFEPDVPVEREARTDEEAQTP